MGVINLSIIIDRIKKTFQKKADLSTDVASLGFVKNTDYASTDTGGVVKVSGSLGSAVSSGILQGTTRTQSAYDEGSQALIISKGTLENVFYSLLVNKLIESIATWDTYPTGTKFDFQLVKDENGGHLEYTSTSPTP